MSDRVVRVAAVGSGRVVPASEAVAYIGSYVSFVFYPGWSENELVIGWLHGVIRGDTDSGGFQYWLQVDESPVCDDAAELAGYAVEEFELLCYVDKEESDE